MERDFTNAKLNRLGMYGGTNGSKISIDYKGETNMLKSEDSAEFAIWCACRKTKVRHIFPDSKHLI